MTTWTDVLADGVVLTTLLLYLHSRFGRLEDRCRHVETRLSDLRDAIADLQHTLDHRFDALEQRLADLRDMWRAELGAGQGGVEAMTVATGRAAPSPYPGGRDEHARP